MRAGHAGLPRRRHAGGPARIPAELVAALENPLEPASRSVVHHADHAGVGRRAGGARAAGLPVAVVVVADLPQDVPAAARGARHRRVRGRILERRRPERPLPAHGQARTGSGLEHIFTRRLPRILQAPQAGQLVGRSRWTARAARCAPRTSAKSTRSKRTCRARHRGLGVARTSACSAPCGAS